jgi:hypothetical protein
MRVYGLNWRRPTSPVAGKGNKARKQFLAGLACSLDRALRGRVPRASRRRHSCRW